MASCEAAPLALQQTDFQKQIGKGVPWKKALDTGFRPYDEGRSKLLLLTGRFSARPHSESGEAGTSGLTGGAAAGLTGG